MQPGSFMMGGSFSSLDLIKESNSKREVLKRENLFHPVNLQCHFYFQTTPVTIRQWKRVMGDIPSYFKNVDENCPVESVSWDYIKIFIEKLNSEENTRGYRLPSEAEWEYACRAGSTTKFFFGDDEKALSEFCWYKENSNNLPRPVKKKKPNPWGLYDMHGNVWEWVEDEWHNNYATAPNDGRAWTGSPRENSHVIRGGSWLSDVKECTSSARAFHRSGYRHYYLGFRLAKSVDFGR